MQPEQDNWKQKYLANLDRLEQSEKNWNKLEELLRFGLARVALAAQGVDKQLDRHLSLLRKNVRSGSNYDALELVLDDISQSVKRLDEQRNDSIEELSQASDVLISLLTQLAKNKAFKKPLKLIIKSLEKDKQQPLDTILNQVADIINHTIQQPHGDNHGLLSQIFSKKSPSHENHQTTDSGTLPANENIEDKDGDVEKVNNQSQYRNNNDLAKTRSESSGNHEQQQVASFCLQLLDSLQLPEFFAPYSDVLKSQLQNQQQSTDTGDILSKMASLITATRLRAEQEKHELQQFLKQLTDRLQDIDQHLNGAEMQRQASVNNHQQLETVVEKQVKNIESSVQEASDLKQLKTDIQQRVTTIRSSLESYSRDESQYQQVLEQQLAQSNQRLVVLEKESQELKRKLMEEHIQATHDTLTGIHNRLAFEERINQEYTRWKRYQSPLSLAVFDIDYFKKINDSYGHKAGDRALQLIASKLKEKLRESDFIARYGGEEFVLIMPETDSASALIATEKLREAVMTCEFHYNKSRVTITVSAGVATFCNQDTAESVFQRADKALYQAKQNGRNQCYTSPETT